MKHTYNFSDPVSVVEENRRRVDAEAGADHDPVRGDSHDPGRTKVTLPFGTFRVPAAMLADERYPAAQGSEKAFDRLRFLHDFPYWAVKCVKITHKITRLEVPFVLNAPQRRLLGEFEKMRLAGEPIRLIMLKARQWGGSTLVQIYFAWIQMIHRRNWNSLICAHVKDTSATIRGMYTRLLASYPQEYWDEEDAKCEFRPYERMTNVRVIPGRECKVTICSSDNQESARGQDIALAHLSEVAFWKDSTLHSPLELMRSVASGIARKPLTAIIMESTANGVGNFFHTEWLRASGPQSSDKVAFFVPWYEIEIYRTDLTDAEALAVASSLTPYEQELFGNGCLLQAIAWHREKSREFSDERSMHAEYPSSAQEAFATTDRGVFSQEWVERLREGCETPRFVGDILSGRLCPVVRGPLEVWRDPEPGASYIVSLDIGGRTPCADFSVATVLRRKEGPRPPEVVAQWRGHVEHDLLAHTVADLGERYNCALLVVESNSWEASSEGHGRFILDRLEHAYGNIYRRMARDGEPAPGFHTNQRTKPALIANLVAMVRDGAFVERSHAALAELLDYEQRPDGSYGARSGRHDDILMSRAIAMYVDAEKPLVESCGVSHGELLDMQCSRYFIR